jgi:glucose/arabinose dehydrogenase
MVKRIAKSVLHLILICGVAVSTSYVRLSATVISGFYETTVVSGISGGAGRSNGPSSMAVTPDGRVLITTPSGSLRVVENGSMLAAPAITLNAYSGPGVEHGLMSIAVDPNFAVNNFVYMYYSKLDAGGSTFHYQLSRFTLSSNTIDPASETVIKSLSSAPVATSIFHGGGGLGFGSDGKIYLAVGDHFMPGASNVSQDLSSPFGKVLRFNPDGSTPSDNPFVGTSGALGDIYALGLRNPFTMQINPANGQTIINDVGEYTWEEANLLSAGANYGWNLAEGNSSNPLFSNALYQYAHDASLPVCAGAIVGGAFSESLNSAFADNSYFFGDFCAGWIRSVDVNNPVSAAPLATNLGFLVALAPAPGGGLYYLTQSGGGQLGLIDAVPEPSYAIFSAVLLGGGLLLRRRPVCKNPDQDAAS